MAMLLCAFSANAQESVVAKIGNVEYTTFASAMAAANAATEDVTVEVYGAVEFVDGMELDGSYTAITFTGKSAEAKITINQTAGGDYLTAHGKTVAFNELILAKANPAWSGNSGHMGNYFSIQGGTVTYTDCTFPNGACTSTGTAVYNNCTFQNASEYGLWVYDDALVTVNGGTIDSTKGIKVYSEGEDSVTSTLTVQNATFTENVTAKPAVAIGYAESITLIGNTYNNTTGHVELDSGSDADCDGIAFVAEDSEGNDISSELTVVDRSNSSAACGVLVDGKIYTTVTTAAAEATSGSTVTLLYSTTETVELPEGVTLDTNGFTANNVTVEVSLAGEGTEASPYLISSVADLETLRNKVNAGNSYEGQFVKLAADLTLTEAWTPIGNGTRSSKSYSGNAFKGTFDGDNKTISGLKITSTTANDAAIGLFGVVDGGTVKNLTLNNVDINVANSNLAGGAIGLMLGGATAENITVNGAIVGYDGVGGIVGRLVINGTIKDCTNNASVTSSYGGIGGIVGKAYYEDSANTSIFASIDNCTNNGTVTAPMYVGGIVGLARANVTDCVNNGPVVGGTQTGGIIGQLIAAGTVSGNENKAKITGKNHLGGIIGDYSQSSAYTYYNVAITSNINRGELAATEQCAAIMGCNNIDGFTAMTATGNVSYYFVDGLELFGNPEDMVIDDTNKFISPAVAKIGDVEYATLAEAVAAVEDGGTITMIANETFTENNRYDNGGWWDGLGYSGDKSFTIDLNNFTISQDGALNDNLMWFKNDGAKDNTITLKNGTLDAGTTAYCALATASSNAKKITVNLENISLINNNSDGSTVKVRGGAVLNVKDGTVITGKDSYLGVECWAATVNIYDGAEIYMNGTSSYNGCLAGAGGNGTINVYGGKGLGKSGGFIAMTSGGTINVEGGEWIANTDGTYANSNKSVLVAQSDKQYNAGAGNSIVNVTGGTFKGGYNCYGNAAGDAQINISGGNFNADPATYLAQNYVAVENNGVWNVELAAAKVGETAYATLEEAISAAQAGDVVEVFEGTYAVPAMKSGITIEGVGNVLLEGTLSGTLENLTLKNLHIKGANAQRWAYAKGNLVFENVTFEATSVYALHFDGITEGTTLLYKDCTIIGWAAMSGSPASCVFDGCTIKDNGTYGVIRTYFDATIENCTFDVADANTSDVYQDGIHAVSGAEITVNGCTNVNGEMKDLVNVSGASVVTVDGVEIKNVAQVGETKYTSLQKALDAAAAGTGNVTVTILADVDLTDVDWNPVTVSAPGYPVVTVEGGNHTITGLNDMLFHSTWAGGSGLIIKDLTIAESAIVNDKDDAAGTVGVGAFIGYPQASATITLENCHLKNSSVEGGHWTGGLIGMAGGYNGEDGPVFMNLTIKGCSVTGSTITGKGSVGGVIGHGSCAAWTNVVIEETTVSGNTITSTGSSNVKAGAIMGTIGAAGQPTTANGETKTGGASVSATVAGNTVTSNGTEITTIYGRQGTSTGQLYVAGGSYDNYPIEENVAYAAPIEGYEIVQNTDGTYGVQFASYIVLPDGVDSSNYAELFGDNTVTDGTNYYATLQAAVEAVAGQTNAVLYCKPGADVGSLQHAPVTSTLTVYGNGADVTGDTERDFDLGNTDPSGGKDITADMTLTVKHLNGCGAWGAKATEHTVNLVFENCANMGKVFITGTTGTLNITMTDCAFEGVIKEAVYSNADGAITLTNVAFSNLNKAVNLNHKAAGTQTVTINGCTFTDCGADVATDQIPVRVLSSVEGGKSVLTVTGSTFTGTPEGGADILLDYGVGLTTASVSGTAANVVVEKENNVGTTTAVKADETVEFTTALPVADLQGEGTETNPFLISSVDDLVLFRNSVNAGETKYSALGIYVALGADIDLAGENWIGIGSMTADHGFMGNFDGKNFKIKNLTIDNPALDSDGYAYAGLFALTEGTDKDNQNFVKNLTIENVTINTTGHIASAAIAYAYYTVVDNVTVCGNIAINGGDYTAGVLAYTRRCVNASNIAIIGNENSYVKGARVVGGVISDIQMNGGLIADYSNFSAEGVAVSGTDMVGGISGIIATQTLDGATVKNVTLNSNDGRVGIVAGCFGGTSTISNVAVETVTGATAIVGPTYNDSKAVEARIGDTYYATLQAAATAAKDNETVTLLADVETADGIVITDKNLVIDLNGKTYTTTEGASTNNRNFKIEGTSVVTIKNGTMVAAGDYSSGAYGTVRTEGSANVTLEGLKLYNYRGNGLNIKACAGTTVTVKDTEIYANYGGGIESAGGTIVVDNVTVEQKGMYTAPYNSMAISVNGGGKVTVNSGTFSTECITAEEANNQGTSHGPWVAGVLNSGGTLIINGGTFSNDNFGENSLATNARGAILADTKAKVEINGGKFNVLKNVIDIQNNLGDANNNPSVVLAGGTYNADPRISAQYGSNLITLADGCVALPDLSGNYVVGTKPTATVNNLGMTTVAAGDYMVYGSGDNTADMPLSFVMQFLADQTEEDMATSPYADWYGDFVITFTGLENGSFTADGCYLAGHYGSFGWVKVPVDGMTIEEGARYPVMLGVGMGQKYDYICSSVQDFKCALYLTPEILEANPNIQVKLELGVVDNSKGEDAAASALVNNENVYSVTEYTYDADDFVVDPNYIAELTIDDAAGENYTNDTEKTVGKLTYKRTLPAAGIWYPVFLPFDVPVDALDAELFDVARINDLHTNFSEEDGSIEKMWVEYIVRKSGTLAAGKPFLVKAKSSDDLEMVIELENATLYPADKKSTITVSSVITEVTFEGVYESLDAPVSTPSTRYLAVNANGVWDEFDGYSLNPFRVMMTLKILEEEYYIGSTASLSVGVRVIGEENEDGTTTIYDVEVDRENDGAIYDLQGRRVLETEKGGMYIVNGKKVLVK